MNIIRKIHIKIFMLYLLSFIEFYKEKEVKII